MSNESQNKRKPSGARSMRGAGNAQAAEGSVRRGRDGKLFSVSTAPADANPILPLAPRRPQRSWRLWALLCAVLVGGVAVWLRAQDQPVPVPAVVPVPVTAEDDQSATPGQMEDVADQNASAEENLQTNGPVQIGTLGAFSQTNSPGRRSRRSYRRRPGTASGADTSSGTDLYLSSRPTNAVPRAAFSTFSIITKRNIFDPNRHGDRVPGPIVRPVRSEHITLVGTMSYEKGTFAFFDGDSSEYQEALQKAGKIAGYTVTDIQPDLVKLTAGATNLELKVGMQLRREEGGPWHVSAAPETYASTATLASPSAVRNAGAGTDSAPSGPVSDILQRLMKQREQE